MPLKAKITAALLSVVLMGGCYFLLANAHIDVFPCQVWEYDFMTESHKATPRPDMCSLLDKSRSGLPRQDRIELTFLGHVIAVALVVALPMAAGLAISRRFVA